MLPASEQRLSNRGAIHMPRIHCMISKHHHLQCHLAQTQQQCVLSTSIGSPLKLAVVQIPRVCVGRSRDLTAEAQLRVVCRESGVLHSLGMPQSSARFNRSISAVGGGSSYSSVDSYGSVADRGRMGRHPYGGSPQSEHESL